MGAFFVDVINKKTLKVQFKKNFVIKFIVILLYIVEIVISLGVSAVISALLIAITIIPAYIWQFFRLFKIIFYWKSKSFEKKQK
jgi:hypothetical protein